MDEIKVEQDRWQQTLEAIESASVGKLVDAAAVHNWLRSWGKENEPDAPMVAKND